MLKELKDFNIHCLDTSLGGHPVHPLQRIKANNRPQAVSGEAAVNVRAHSVSNWWTTGAAREEREL